MKTLHSYLKRQLTQGNPVIDHSIRAELHADGKISFYIHASDRDSDTADFWVCEDGAIFERFGELPDPLPTPENHVTP